MCVLCTRDGLLEDHRTHPHVDDIASLRVKRDIGRDSKGPLQSRMQVAARRALNFLSKPVPHTQSDGPNVRHLPGSRKLVWVAFFEVSEARLELRLRSARGLWD